MPKEPAYGRVFIGADEMPAEHVEQVLGFRVGRSGDDIAGIDLHFVVKDEPRRLTLPVSQALYLLMMLKAMQLNEELPFPDDPRDESWRPPETAK